MREWFIISCLLLSIQSFGQTSDSLPKRSKIQVGLIYVPEINNRNIFDIHAPDYPMDEQKTKEPMYGYTTGIAFRFLFNSHWALETGVYYSKKGFFAKEEEIYWHAGMPAYLQLRCNYYFVEIPLKVNYRFGKGKWKYSISAGVSANLLDNSKEEAIVRYGDGNKTIYAVTPLIYSYDYLNPAVLLGFGFHYNLTKNFSIMMEPNYLQFIGSVAEGWDYERDLLFGAGIRVGIFYQFNGRK